MVMKLGYLYDSYGWLEIMEIKLIFDLHSLYPYSKKFYEFYKDSFESFLEDKIILIPISFWTNHELIYKTIQLYTIFSHRSTNYLLNLYNLLDLVHDEKVPKNQF